MNIDADGKVLEAATRQLRGQWLDARESWQDRRSAEFEERFLSELLGAVERSSTAFDRLEKLVATVRKQCE